MQKIHYIAIATAAGLIALLFRFGNTVPPPKAPVAATQQPAEAGHNPGGPNTVKPASFDSILTVSKMRLPKAAADSVKTMESELTAIRDSSRMAVAFERLAGVWQRNMGGAVAAFYLAKAAKLENSEKKLTFAGQNFLLLMENEHSPSVQKWEVAEGIGCLEQSLKINPDNEEAKLALAAGYIQGTGEPMKGVQILLAIVKEKPNDVPANMLLGRMAIQSGQYDKAVGRFETVLQLEPENREALYFQAQAYAGKGDKKKAIELLERCKKLVNDPEFSKDIDQQINTLK